MDSIWKIVFKGEILVGFDSQQVKQELSQLLKINDEQVKKLFSGKEVILKKQQPLDKAEKYKQAFEKRGIKVYLLQEPPAYEQEPFSLSLVPVEEKKSEPEEENHAESEQNMGLSLSQNNQQCQKIDSGNQSERQSNGSKKKVGDEFFNEPYKGPANQGLVNEWISDRDMYVDAPDIFSLSFEGRYGRLNHANAAWIAKIVLIVGFLISIKNPNFLFLLIPLLLVYTFRITALRLHDLNLPAWYSIPGLLLPVILALAEADIFSALIYVLFELLLLIYPGNEGSNNYGPRSEQGSVYGLVLICLAVPRLVIGFLADVS